MKSTVRDMTVGSPASLIIGFTLPMLLSVLLQQLYSMADTVVAGRWLGINALSAIGCTGSITFLIIGFCNGLTSGFAIPISQSFGAKNYSAIRSYFANCLWLCAGISAVITFFACYFCRDILLLMNTQQDIIDDSELYLFIIFAGIPCTCFSNTFAGEIRALGDSRTPLYIFIFTGLLNVVFNILSICVLGMGVEGPALATVLCQFISCVICIIHIVRKFEILHFRRAELRPRVWCMRTLLSMGLPMGLQFSVTAIGSVILQSAVNGLGTVAVAAMTAGDRVVNLFLGVLSALGSAISTYSGQNIGAKRIDRVDKGLRSALFMGWIYSVAAFVLLFFAGKFFMLLFIDKGETEIIALAYRYILCNGVCLVLLTVVNIVRACIQGIGHSALAMFAGVFELVARTLTGIVLVPTIGFWAVCISSPIAWLLADIFLIPAYLHCRGRQT